MGKHWREKIVAQTENGKIIKHTNISTIFNDVDYYVLLDKDWDFVSKSTDYNVLHSMLYGE